jgi:hypothetical protein
VLEYLASYRVASSGSKRVRQRIIEVANSRRLVTGTEKRPWLGPLTERTAVIPAAHSARLIALGYMADIAARLRMITVVRRQEKICHKATGRPK